MTQETPKPKRGRPPKNSLVAKQEEGKNTISEFKCKHCYRVFPRRKSVAAHEITHTGAKPHKCDYPRCSASFTQTGNFRSHTYLHTGEKPYACPATGCTVRFTHSNRTCPHHPFRKLIRDGNHEITAHLWIRSRSELNWLKRYKKKTSAKVAKVCNRRKLSTVNNPKRNSSIEPVHSDAESFNKETFPLNTSTPVAMYSYKCNGYGSCSGTEPSSPPGQNKPPEEMNVDSNSLAQPPKITYTVEVERAALILMQLKRGAYWSKPTCNPNS